MTKESTLVMQTNWWPSIIYGIVTYFQRHKKSRKKIEKKSKIQEDTLEESLEDCPSW
jgi:hypothetical protein